MKQVRIVKPVEGYEVGDTPTLPGSKVRELVNAGLAVRVEDEAKPAAHKPAAKAKR